MQILITVAVISTITVLLAAILTIAERYILNYGTCVIDINDDKKLEVKGGGSLLSTLNEQGIFIPSACGGRGSCGLCKVAVLSGGGPLLPTEKPYLAAEELDKNIRLSCQVKVRENIKIQIPKALFAIKSYNVTVQKIEDLTHDIKTLYLKLADEQIMDFKAGQYIQIKTPRYAKVKEEVYRAYSIASTPSHKDEIQVIIRKVPQGICTTYVFDYLKQGDTITLNGPYGDFYLRDTQKEVICIAGGSGLAPIKSILHQMAEQGIHRKTTFFFGCVSKQDLYYQAEMQHFEKTLPDFQFVPALSAPKPEDNWQGETGLITEVADRYIKDGANTEAYLCGSPGMVDACVSVLETKGMPKESIFYDKF